MKFPINQVLIKLNFFFTWQYPIKMDHIYYSLKDNAYVVTFRVKFKRVITKMFLNEIIANQNFLKQLNPYDNYILGKVLSCQYHRVFDNAVYNCNNYNILFVIENWTYYRKHVYNIGYE